MTCENVNLIIDKKLFNWLSLNHKSQTYQKWTGIFLMINDSIY